MAILSIILYSPQKSQRIVYKDSDGIMTFDIENTFVRKCDIVFTNNSWARIVVSSKTRKVLLELQSKYDAVTAKHIRKLYGFISKLADGDIFYYLNENNVSSVERRIAYDCVKSTNNDFPTNHNRLSRYYSMLDYNFQYLSYGFDAIAENVGEKEISKRVCRFCGKRHPEVSFNKIAHAIQDALGNKFLFCNEECDTCNHELAPVENNFMKIMDFRRAMFHIPRKETTRTPKVVGKTFIIKPDNNGYPELFIMAESIPRGIDRSKPYMFHFELKEPLTNESMYKALCKMVIDMLPSSKLLHFKNTIKWIVSKGDWFSDSLPSILSTVTPTKKILYPQPVLDIFINNKGKMPDSPYCTAILWIYDIAYMFIMPFVDVDAGRYKYDYDLKAHWRQMSQLVRINHWSTQDSSNHRLSTPWINWKVDLSHSNIHILPKTDSIFKDCFTTKFECPDIGMPSFSKDGIVFVNSNRVEFSSLHNRVITDADLRDLTLHIGGPEFLINPQNRQVQVRLWVDANDTTDTLEFFKYNFDAVFFINTFWDYINLETKENGELLSFAFHYELAEYLLDQSLSSIEPMMAKKRIGTPFEKCSLENMKGDDRIFTYAYYMVPNGTDGSYIKIDDSSIHKIGYQ